MNRGAIIWRFLQRLRTAFVLAKTALFYRRFFGAIGHRSAIYRPTLIGNPRFIRPGDRVMIREGARLEVVLVGFGARQALQVTVAELLAASLLVLWPAWKLCAPRPAHWSVSK